MKILLASKNKGKIKEVTQILADENITVISLLDFPDSPDIEETGSTFLENANLKAKGIFEYYNIPVIADDSGLVVDQLNGDPGVYSARYAGDICDDDANNLKLVSELSSFPEPHQARFVCFAVYYSGDALLYATGVLEGRILHSPRGSNGFGYDPLFMPEGYSITTAEMDSDEKNRISHRGKAFRKLYEIMKGNVL